MKPDQIILVSPRGWVRIAEGQARDIKPWSALEGTALVVADFVESQVGLQACKGKAEYAGAQIEKRVRSEGGIDGPMQVFVHDQLRHEDSTLAFYTAVPLELWQQFQTWAAQQADHCLVVPLAALLPGKGDNLNLLRCGTQLHGYAATDGKIFYAGVAALGNGTDDLRAPLRTLINQLRAAGWKGSSKGVRWGNVLSGDLAEDKELLTELNASGIAGAQLMPHATLRTSQSTQGATALPGLLDAAKGTALQAPPLSKLAWLSEAYVMPLAAMIAVVAIGLGVFAYFAQGQIAAQHQVAQAMGSEIEGLQTRVSEANRLAATTDMDPATVAFVKQLGYAAVHDPVRMLGTVRHAAGSSIRVQRLQLARASQSSAPHFRLDGVVINGSNEALGRFLGELRNKGWQAESVSPNDATYGAFAYNLRPIETTPGG